MREIFSRNRICNSAYEIRILNLYGFSKSIDMRYVRILSINYLSKLSIKTHYIQKRKNKIYM